MGFVVHFDEKSVKIKAVMEKSNIDNEIRKPILAALIGYILKVL